MGAPRCWHAPFSMSGLLVSRPDFVGALLTMLTWKITAAAVSVAPRRRRAIQAKSLVTSGSGRGRVRQSAPDSARRGELRGNDPMGDEIERHQHRRHER